MPSTLSQVVRYVATRFALAKRLPPSTPFLRSFYIKKTPMVGCSFLVETKGLAPLAARPARQLLIAAFAVNLIVSRALCGKAFCSRKTAPTLNSLCAFVLYQKKHPCRVFFFGGDKGTCAFSGAPRSAIINCRLCRRPYRKSCVMEQSVLLSQNGSHPQLPLCVRYISKKNTHGRVFFFGGDKGT